MPEDPQVPMLRGHEGQYVRTQEYSSVHYGDTAWKANHAPLPSVTQEKDPNGSTIPVDKMSINATNHGFLEGDFVCSGFFKRVRLEALTPPHQYEFWTYEMRRRAQPIFPFLFLGPSSCCKDLEFLSSEGFTLLLAVRNRHSATARLVSGEKAAAELRVQADSIDVLDSQELIHTFPRAIRRINDHLAGLDDDPTRIRLPMEDPKRRSKKKVLIFCESGNERSAVLVIAYLMVMLGLSAAQALTALLERRFCASIDGTMRSILSSFESILSAKRDVKRAGHTHSQTGASTLAPLSVPPALLSKKRSFANRQNDDDDDDIVMGDGDMIFEAKDDPQSGRRPFAPFKDAKA